MKRLIYITLAVFITLTSCNKSETVSDEEVTVNYTVAAPATKATLGNGDAVNYVWYALYRTDGSLMKEFTMLPFIEGKALCPVTMVRNQSYKVVFVAQHYDVAGGIKTPVYAVDANSATLSMPSSAVANSDNYDVFCFVDEVLHYDGISDAKSVIMTRKVAQINYLCSSDDAAAAAVWGMTPTSSKITLNGVPASYNILSDQMSDNAIIVEYAKAPLTSDVNLLGTAFCFAGDNLTYAQLQLYKDTELTTTLSVDNVPVETNRRTNITGSFMTGTVDYNISINTDDTEINYPLN